VPGGDDEVGQHPFTFHLAFGPAVQTLRASSKARKVTSGWMWIRGRQTVDQTRTVDDTQTLQLHTSADRPLALLAQGLRIVRLAWLGRYFDTEIRPSSAGPLTRMRDEDPSQGHGLDL
jgi:hypothetical protein